MRHSTIQVKVGMLLAPAAVAALLAACGASSNGHEGTGSRPATESKEEARKPAGASPEGQGIPQGNGGDHDGDNNGGPSDGDGAL
ncbi:MAG: hypothetical protein KGJ43_09480 [Acidobacteriota bacterium]|nr:hypothetical protein [Acidobacteriota bacterium]